MYSVFSSINLGRDDIVRSWDTELHQVIGHATCDVFIWVTTQESAIGPVIQVALEMGLVPGSWRKWEYAYDREAFYRAFWLMISKGMGIGRVRTE